MTKLTPFPCTACGKCCRKVNLSELTVYLAKENGVCRYFDEQSNLCTIYATRPLVCRVEDYYKHHLSHLYQWDEFIKMNLEICEKL